MLETGSKVGGSLKTTDNEDEMSETGGNDQKLVTLS